MVLSAQLARIGQQMVAVAMVLFVLTRYHSPALAGLVTFVSIFPGLLVSPIAGALLDRHGRQRLIILDYLVAGGTLVMIGGLALAGALPVWLLLAIALVSSLSAPLSNSGMRSLYPLIVPRRLWERANAIDSNGYVIASIIGPAVAGLLFGFLGGPIAILATASLFGIAAAVLIGVRDPETNTSSSGSLLLDAWDGLRYVLRNATLRGLAYGISIANLGNGIVYIALPVLILQRFHRGPETVGLMFAVLGLFGMITVTLFGRIRSKGIERQMLGYPQFVMALSLVVLAFAPSLPVVVLALALGGLAVGPIDIALFTLRQRRTDPAWMGRAFAISMSLNFSGIPIGSAIGGPLVTWSLTAAILVGAALSALAGFIPLLAIPAEGDYVEPPATS